MTEKKAAKKPETTAPPPKPLAAKLATVMGKIDGYLKKDGKVEFGRTSYGYVTSEAVLSAVRTPLAEEGVTFWPQMIEVDRIVNNERVHVARAKFLMTFIDGATGESLSSSWYSEAVDTQDKSLNKCATAAVKYFLLKFFLIPTGDEPDPDAQHSDEPAGKAKPAEKPTEKNKANSVQIKELRELVKAIGQEWEAFAMYVNGSTGVDVNNMTYAQANHWIDRLKKKKAAPSATESLKQEVTGDAVTK